MIAMLLVQGSYSSDPALRRHTWQLSPPSAVGIGEQAAYAEDHGYQSFWLPENHFGEGALPDPLMLLASAAARRNAFSLRQRLIF